MRIGFYGNANNYPFMLAQAMRRQGHEVRFLVASREPLNRPEFRYGEIKSSYPDWIVDVSSRTRWHALIPGSARTRIAEELNACDVAILNEEGPALASELRVPYAALLTGSDLEVFANPKNAHMLKPLLIERPLWLRRLACLLMPTAAITSRLTRPQRAGVRTARAVIFMPRGLAPKADALLAEIGVPDEALIQAMFTDVTLVPFTPPRNNATLRVFSATRLTWIEGIDSDLTSLDLKGSEVMVRGLDLFTRSTGRKLDIHLVRKGRHVAQLEHLLASLGLGSQVTWHNEMSQLEVLAQFQKADIVMEQLAGSAVGMAGLDALATGRPVIANGRPEVFRPLIGEPSPICQAKTPEEVGQHLLRLQASPNQRAEIGMAGRHYVERHFSSDSVARLVLARFGCPK